MARKAGQFSAKDAFIYTDSYRKAIKLSAATIATDKERLKERFRRGGGLDPSYYAELRALEHALNYVVKGEEPGDVVLGELDGTDKQQDDDPVAKLTARIGELQKVEIREKEEKERLRKDLKTVGEAYQRLQQEATELRNLTTRLRRKVSQTSSTFGVVGFAMFVVIVVLMVVMAKR